MSIRNLQRNRRLSVPPCLMAGLALMLSLPAGVVFGQTSTQVIVVSGQSAPGGNGSFASFGDPKLNDAGQAAFTGLLAGTSGGDSDNVGIFRADPGVSGLVQIVRKGQVAPGGNNFADLGYFLLSDAGQAMFVADLNVPFQSTTGLFRGDGGVPMQVARSSQPAPDDAREFVNLGFPNFNDVGNVAFRTQLSGVDSDRIRIYRGGPGTLVSVARSGQVAPGGSENFVEFGHPALNDAGQTAFAAILNGLTEPTGIYRADGATLVQFARTGQPAPDNNGSFSFFQDPSLNQGGQVAFVATSLTSTIGGASDNSGIFRGDPGATGPVQIARAGQDAPGGDRFARFGRLFTSVAGSSDPILNAAGQAAFVASLVGNGGFAGRGIFRGDGVELVQVARTGQNVPGGSGSFLNLFSPALNDAGQAAFFADLTGTSGGSSDDEGIFFFDDILGLLTVAREGDILLGSVITDLSFNQSNGLVGDEGSGFNNAGQLGYSFALADGRSGVAIFSIPEPSMLGLLALGVLAIRRGQKTGQL